MKKKAAKKKPAPAKSRASRRPRRKVAEIKPLACTFEETKGKACKRRAQVRIKSAHLCGTCAPIYVAQHKGMVSISPIAGAPDGPKVMSDLIFAMKQSARADSKR